MLRTVIDAADQKDRSVFLHFERPTKSELVPDSMNIDLNKLMQNIGGEQFDYETFRAAFETDPRVKTMVSDYNAQGVTLKTKNAPENLGQDDQFEPNPDSDVTKMAKNAVDLDTL